MKSSGAENVRSGEINPVTLIGLHRRGFLTRAELLLSTAQNLQRPRCSKDKMFSLQPSVQISEWVAHLQMEWSWKIPKITFLIELKDQEHSVWKSFNKSHFVITVRAERARSSFKFSCLFIFIMRGQLFVYIYYKRSAGCLYISYQCQLFVYIYHTNVSCLFIFIIRMSAVCLHLS